MNVPDRQALQLQGLHDRQAEGTALEEQRIGRMYLNLLKARLADVQYAMFGRGLRRSSLLPWLLVLVLVVPIVGYSLHVHGRFRLMKNEIKGPPPAPNVPRPGGSAAVVLKRGQTSGSNLPELLSATLLPGLGMEVLQISAYLPGRGEVELLSAPTVDQMASGTGADRAGANDDWGAIELPWAGSLPGVLSPLGTTLSTYWKGRTLELPVYGTAGRSVAEGGLLVGEPTEAQVSDRGDGQTATAAVKATDFSGRWPSRTDVNVSVQLQARSIDLTVSATNSGGEPEPMGIGWHPRFVIPSGDRGGVELKLPNGQTLEVTDRIRDLPTGKIVPASERVARLQVRASEIGAATLDESVVHLKPGLMDLGSMAEFRDPASGFGVRMIAISSNIREFRVLSPTGSRYVAFGMQTNLDDPLGHEWTGEDAGGIAILQPGQSVEWKVRLEIFPVMNSLRSTP